MPIQTLTTRVDLNPGGVPPIIHLSQYDAGSRTLSFTLTNAGTEYDVPDGAAVTIRGTKKDKTGFEYACSYSGSTVSVDVTDQMTVYAGDVEAELRITSGTEILGTANMILRVESSALADDTTVSDTTLPLLEQATEAANQAKQYADNAAASAEAAQEAAESVSITVDTAMSDTSTNAVQNSTIKAYVDAETTRATAAEEANATAISTETARATAAEEANATAISTETARATAAEEAIKEAIKAQHISEVVSVPITGWTERTIDGTAYYQYAATMTNSYQWDTVGLMPAATGTNSAPTADELAAFNLVCMYGVDDAGGTTLNLIASSAPETVFNVLVSGVKYNG